jgi:chromosome segregation ATPase
MSLIDFDKLAKQYATVEDDFGFSAVSEEEYNSVINKATSELSKVASTADDYKDRLTQLENMIVPFLTKLHSTGDKEYIYWPNRKPVIEKQIEKILKLTRD